MIQKVLYFCFHRKSNGQTFFTSDLPLRIFQKSSFNQNGRLPLKINITKNFQQMNCSVCSGGHFCRSKVFLIIDFFASFPGSKFSAFFGQKISTQTCTTTPTFFHTNRYINTCRIRCLIFILKDVSFHYSSFRHVLERFSMVSPW